MVRTSHEDVAERDGEVIDPEAVERSLVTGANWEQQVATARKYPRDIVAFKRDLVAMATMDEETAASCQYSVPRGGKSIDGPSVRLAEMVAATYGNLQISAQVTGHDDRFVYAEAVVRDLEKNITMGLRVRRRITDKHGQTYNEDMIAVTGSAAVSIVYRNAIFKVVPAAFVQSAYNESQAMLEAAASADLKNAVPKMFTAFADMGVNEEEILRYLQVEKKSDVRGIHLVRMRGVLNAIKDGVRKESYFKPPRREVDMGDPDAADTDA